MNLDRLTSLLALPDVTWRHDVDANLQAAVRMAELEARLGVRATFYIMSQSPYYNPWSWEGHEALRQINRCGHRIGLHLDLDLARAAPIRPWQIAAMADEERCRLAGRVSRALSFHCPPDSLLWVEVPGFESAYAPRWRDHYLSDSRGRFTLGDPEDHLERPLQINLHPEHWFGGLPPTGDRPEFWR